MEMFQYSEKKVRMGWHSPALCAVSSRLSFSVGCMLPSASRCPPAASWRAGPLGHIGPLGEDTCFFTLLCPSSPPVVWHNAHSALHRESHTEPSSTLLSPALPALPSTPREENHGELGICLHRSPPGGNEEPGR